MNENKPRDQKPGFQKPFKPRPAGGRPPFNKGKPSFGRPMNSTRPSAPAKPLAKEPSKARRAALQAVSDILQKEAYASQAINDQLKDAGISQLDKRLCTNIVYSTIENLTAIDFALSFFLKDGESLEPRVRDILRISVCQYLFMDKIPENAVVDEAVSLTRFIGLEGLTGLVNGVLRNLIRGKDDIKWPEEDDEVKYLSVRYSMPEWLVQKLLGAYGVERGKQIIAYRPHEHYMTLRPNLTRLSDEQFEALLEKKVWEAERGSVLHAWRVQNISQIARDNDYLNGSFSVQGESSMLCAQIADVKRGMQVLDCCAAPGGKTAYMAEMMSGTGRVYAWDLHDHRVALLRAMQYRLGLDNIRASVRDARMLKSDMIGTLDLVLLDAPCTGLGVVDDKPDIKYRVTDESLRELVETQKALLETCSQYVKQNGTLVYSTCSILPEENEKQIKHFLSAHPEFVLDALPAHIDERFKSKMGEYGLQLLASEDGMEGFFIARLKRVRY